MRGEALDPQVKIQTRFEQVLPVPWDEFIDGGAVV